MSLFKTSTHYTYSASLFPPFMDRFIREGEELYQFLIENFDTMFNKDNTLIFVDIRYFSDSCQDYLKDIHTNDSDDIKREYSVWLLQEKNSGRLFDRANWQIYRNRDVFTDMYLGYRILFIYKQYYFQVSYDFYFFALGLYGWKDKQIEALQPDNLAIILSDQYISDRNWYYSV